MKDKLKGGIININIFLLECYDFIKEINQRNAASDIPQN